MPILNDGRDFTTYYYDNNVIVGVYAKKAGVWTKLQDYSVYVSGGSFPNGGDRTFSWSVDDNFQLGTGVQAFGITITSVDLGSAAITAFSNAKWQAQVSTGSTRSATPNGEQSVVTVRPL